MNIDTIKIGGAAGVDLDAIADDLALLLAQGRRFVVLHGGSDETNRLAESLGHPSRFVESESGHTSRVTDRRTLEIFAMATASLNRSLVERLQARGVPAFGLSGLDGRLIEADRKAVIRVVENGRRRIIRDDWTGRPRRVNGALLKTLLDAGQLPVIAPLGVSPAGEMLNIDGDRAAAQIAGALSSESLLILSNVVGLLRDPERPETLISRIAATELDQAEAVAQGRMRKKVLGAKESARERSRSSRHRLGTRGATDPIRARGSGDDAGRIARRPPGDRGRTGGMSASSSQDILDLELRHGDGAARPRDIVIESGRGCRVRDPEGREWLDLTSAYGVTPLGHSHPRLVAAISEQASRLVSCSTIFGSEARATYRRELAEATQGLFERFFLCNSGTEAVEAALKMARITTGRSGVVAARRGFHGRTFGALSATWEPKYRDVVSPLLAGFQHVAYDDSTALDEAIRDEVGVVLLEIVQGEGGVRPGRTEYFQRAQELCRERGALLALDEVQTGFGRTGRLFAYEHHALEPDLVCLAKGMAGGFPMGAVAMGSRVTPLRPGQHGSTFGGNPLACAAARATLATIHEEALVDRAAERGAYFLQRLRAIESPRVREIRGSGLMIGVELREPAVAVLRALQDRGVLALAAGPRVVRFLPPLTVSVEEIDEAVSALRGVLEVAAPAAGAGR